MAYSPRLVPFGPVGIAGGVDLLNDALQIEDSESPESVNFVHQGRTLRQRQVLSEYGGFSSGVGSRGKRWNGLDAIRFEDGDQYIATLNEDYFYTHDGTTWTNRSGGVITAGADTAPWDTAFGIDGGFGGTGTFFAANGSNGLVYWNPDDNVNAFLLTSPNATFTYSGGPATMAPRYVTVFGGMLVLGHILEGSDVKGTRTRASAINDFLEFDTANGADVTDHASNSSGELTGLATLQKQLLIFKEDAVIIGQETGDSTSPLVFPLELRTGCISGSSFRAITPSVGIFLGQDNVYVYEGGTTSPIGDKIAKNLIEENLNFEARRMIVSSVDYKNSIYRLIVPIGSNSYATRCYAFNWVEKKWWIEEYETEVHSSAIVDFGGGTLIKDLTGLISSYSSTLIREWGPQSRSPSLLYGTGYSSSDFRIHKAVEGIEDESSGTVEVNPSWTSKDFRLNESGYATLRMVGIQYSSTADLNVTLEVSTDRGATYSYLKTKTAEAGTNKILIFKPRATGLHHRIRISTTVQSGAVTNPIKIQTVEGRFVPRRSLR